MTWVKMDDGYASHPKIAALGPERSHGIALDVAAWGYAAQHLTDGFIPHGIIPSLLPIRGAQRVADRLVEVGRWERVADGYFIHDYLVYNPSRATALARQEQAARAGHARAGTAPREGGRFAPTDPTPGVNPTDALVTYLTLTGRVRPSTTAQEWINRLTDAYGEEPVVEALVEMWKEEPAIATLLGRTEGRCRVRSMAESSARDKRKRNERVQSEVMARRVQWFRQTGEWEEAWGERPA